MTIEITLAAPEELDAARACYARGPFRAVLGPGERVVVAKDAGEVVAVVRLVEEHGHLLLRSMFVDEPHRARGLGTRMLHDLVPRIGDRTCWLVCGAHLPRFYGQVGFVAVEDRDAPRHLAERTVGYRERYGPQQIMRRG